MRQKLVWQFRKADKKFLLKIIESRENQIVYPTIEIIYQFEMHFS